MLSASFIENFHFLRPWWALLSLPLVALLWQQRRVSDKTRGWDRIIAPHLLDALRIRQFRAHWFNPVNAAALFLLLMMIVLMGPSWRQQASPLTRDEAALVILLDASASMQQTDIQPSRLIRGKQKITDLLDIRKGSRTALVVYAGSAHTVLTLSNDNAVLGQFLQAIKPGMMPRTGKFAEYALPLVDKIVAETSAPTTVLLLTDGVSANTNSAFSDYFSNRQHQLLILGMGSTVAEDGIAPLEEDALRDLADTSGGYYQSLTTDKKDLRSLQRRINNHYVVVDDQAIPWLDAGYWLVFPGLILFSLWFRRGWTLQWCLAGLLFTGLMQPNLALADERGHGFADLWLTPDQQGRILFQQGRYRAAADRFNNPMWKGLAWYYAEDFKLAAEYFSRVDTLEARFNRANALAHEQNYLPAVRAYDQVLSEDPNFKQAQQNRDIVQAIIDEINLLSASQNDDRPGGDASRELGDDDPRRADGAERNIADATPLQQFSADQLLQDPAISAMWLRGVQRDPSHFLAVKFSMQLESQGRAP